MSKENAELVAQHLVAASELIGVDPEAAHAHAQTAAARGSRVAGVREAAGIVAYHLGQYAEALRELRTHRRISGSDDNLPLIADAERGRGRPQKALEIFAEATEEKLGHDLFTELLMVAAGAHMDKGEVKEARALLETRSFAGNASGTLVRLLSVYSDVIRMQGDAELAGRYEELARRTAKATGTLFGDEDIDPNANVEIVTLEELELPEETEGEIAGPGESEVEIGRDIEPGSDREVEPGIEPEVDPEPEGRFGDEAVAPESDDGGAVEVPASGVADAGGPDAAEATSEAALRAVDKEFDQEIVDELDEILADAGTADAGTAGSVAGTSAGRSGDPVADERVQETEGEGAEGEESSAVEAPHAENDDQDRNDRDDDDRDEYEELTEPLFDL